MKRGWVAKNVEIKNTPSIVFVGVLRWLFALSAMNNCELHLAYMYSPFSFNLFKKFIYNFFKLRNTYKQTSTITSGD